MARVHLISRHIDGAIIQELFTLEGIGTMVTELPLETMRQANIDDVGGILQLIEPLENEGVLVRRGRERIEMEIDHFYVMEHDNRTIGCAALYPFAKDKAWRNSLAWRLIRNIAAADAATNCLIFVKTKPKN